MAQTIRATMRYYLIISVLQQPDFKLETPRCQRASPHMNFWFKKGRCGFAMDVDPVFISKDTIYPPLPGAVPRRFCSW